MITAPHSDRFNTAAQSAACIVSRSGYDSARGRTAEFQMIKSIDIRNFRCYRQLTVEKVGRINIIVGDNGTGKTALLEAIFLPLATHMEVAQRMQSSRGLAGAYSGSPHAIEKAIWGDFFHNYRMNDAISVSLTGSGEEARSVTVGKVPLEDSLPLSTGGTPIPVAGPLSFVWKDAAGRIYQAVSQLNAGGLVLGGTGEDLPGFFMFSAFTSIPAQESAQRFSDLSKAKRQRKFVEVFCEEYPWIEDISVELSAGLPLLYATIKDQPEKIPLGNVSGGINRVISIMLGVAARRQSIVLVDEIENGIHHAHHVSIWRSIIRFVREYDSQLFVTTHSEEWLEALAEAASGGVDDMVLWRLERNQNGPVLRQFSGRAMEAAIRGGEVR